MKAHKLVKTIKGLNKRPSNDLVVGIVTKTYPLEIKFDNRFIVNSQHMIIHKSVGSLSSGNRVRGLMVNNGQSIYVLERI